MTAVDFSTGGETILISSPIIRNSRHLVVMNRPSLEKLGKFVKKDGIILVNSSLIEISSDRTDIDEPRGPATRIANEMGDAKVASIVALSAFTARSKIVPMDLLRTALIEKFEDQPELLTSNLRALKRGEEAGRSNAHDIFPDEGTAPYPGPGTGVRPEGDSTTHGGYGVIQESPLERYYRDARVFTI